VVAVAIAVVSYYGHFGESYRSLRAVRAQTATVRDAGEARTAQNSEPPTAARPQQEAAEPARTTVPRIERAARAVQLTTAASGWPTLVLAVAGLGHVVARRQGDRLRLVLLAIALVTSGVIAAAVIAPVDTRFVRYADEFIDRVAYQALPLVAILAGTGAAWAWRRGLLARAVVVALLVLAAATAVERWMGWIE
jgi:hypothetical protein